MKILVMVMLFTVSCSTITAHKIKDPRLLDCMQKKSADHILKGYVSTPEGIREFEEECRILLYR